jgi:beta-barrel assembly-enhancing protease
MSGLPQRTDGYGARPNRGFGGARLLLGLAMAGFALFSYLGQKSVNPTTGETQYVAISPQQEIALGLESAPKMIEEYGGPSQDARASALVEAVGQKVVAGSDAAKSGYEFHFVLLGDPKTINAFALPGGPVFMTEGLFTKLSTEGEIAGVLGHEVGHVIARHGAQQIAQQQLSQGLTGALILSTWDPNDRNSANTAQMAILVSSLVGLKYGREDELEADRLGVRLMGEAGYDPRALLGVMKVLEASSQGGAPPEFFSTHPNPEHREEKIQAEIAEQYPGGVPGGLTP